MHSFQWIQASLGIITALGIARLLESAVNCLISRKHLKLDWIPFAWAASIFLMLLQFSWNLIALEPVVTSWRFSVFVGLLFFVSNLYLAAALILPNSESQADRDLTAWFNDHGRWAMPFIIIYVLLAYPFNWFLLSDSPLNNPASAIIVIIASLTLFAKSRAIHAAATTMMVIVSIGLFVQMITFDH